MILRPPRPTSSPVTLALQAAWMIGGTLLVMVLSVAVQLGAEADMDTGGRLLLTVLTLVLLLFGVPCWRLVTWLRAAAEGRATEADRVRVLSWGAVWQGLTLAWLVFSVGMWAAHPLGLWRGEEFGLALLAFEAVGAGVTVGLLAALRRWVDRQTRTQANAGARLGELAPLLPGTTRWIRAGQALVLAGLVRQMGGPALEPLEVSTAVGTALFDALALELCLRFAWTSAGASGPETLPVEPRPES